MENITVSALFAIVAALLGIAGGYFGLKRNMKADAVAEGKNDGVMLNEIAHIQSGIDEIKKEQARISDMIIDFVKESAVMKNEVGALHRRLDNVERTIADIERRAVK